MRYLPLKYCSVGLVIRMSKRDAITPGVLGVAMACEAYTTVPSVIPLLLRILPWTLDRPGKMGPALTPGIFSVCQEDLPVTFHWQSHGLFTSFAQECLEARCIVQMGPNAPSFNTIWCQMIRAEFQQV